MTNPPYTILLALSQKGLHIPSSPSRMTDSQQIKGCQGGDGASFFCYSWCFLTLPLLQKRAPPSPHPASISMLILGLPASEVFSLKRPSPPAITASHLLEQQLSLPSHLSPMVRCFCSGLPKWPAASGTAPCWKLSIFLRAPPRHPPSSAVSCGARLRPGSAAPPCTVCGVCVCVCVCVGRGAVFSLYSCCGGHGQAATWHRSGGLHWPPCCVIRHSLA